MDKQDMPERIRAFVTDDYYCQQWSEPDEAPFPSTEYVRADLARQPSEADVERVMAGVKRFIDMLEHGYAPFVEGALSAAMCCSGHMCGCRGSSVGEYLGHLLREEVGLSRAALASIGGNHD